ncbi:MAG: cyclodeaminase/cyclohydrolase family protein [Bacillota bacterium]|nr:cyclodeaminase/cyclohydrolase family protein [Bacillota bacterium]
MGGFSEVKNLTVRAYLAELAADSLFPSAGAAAALTGAQAAALFAMVCRVNLRKLKKKGQAGREDVETGSTATGRERKGEGGGCSFWQKMLERSEAYLRRCLELAQADGLAYREVVDGNPQGPAHALEIPLQVAECSRETAYLIERALPESYAPVRADAETALHLARGSKKAALAVARHNLALLSSQSERENYVNKIVFLET